MPPLSDTLAAKSSQFAAASSTRRSAAQLSGETFGTLINLSGRRRFTSQRIVLFTVLAAQGQADAPAKAREALGLFTDAHERLVKGDADLPGVFGDALPRLYFGDTQGDARIRAFAAQAAQVLEAVERQSPRAAAQLDELVQAATPTLAILNQCTQLYEEEAKRHAGAARRHMNELMSEIKVIAKQAKLVAFNAQVVAARAGHTGREFAAVAAVLSDLTGRMDDFVVQALANSQR